MGVRARAVITGVGLVTPIGVGADAAWAAACAGTSGIAPITRFDASTYPVKVAGEVKPDAFNPARYVTDRAQRRSMSRATAFAVAAAQMALEDAELDPSTVDAARMGVSLGSTRAYIDGSFASLAERCLAAEPPGRPGTIDLPTYIDVYMRTVDPLDFLDSLPSMAAATIAARYGAQGPNRTVLTTCASGTQAIGDAARVIERGDADVMFAGGTDSMIHPFGMLGFTLLGAISTNSGVASEVSRPFDARRDGFVMGEGAGVAILEHPAGARRRGARIYGEVAGYGLACDAYRLTDEPLDGRGAVLAMEAALEDAGLRPPDIDYINAHGTSTPLNDRVETAAIKRVWGAAAHDVPISSTKSMTGHLVAAAGAVELIFCLLALRDGMAPPTINYAVPDPQCDLDYIPNRARRLPLRTAMSNSFGFGGQCAVLIVQGRRAGGERA
jgi:3-oxoacyl-[acyl-carrier-protein] synthase II